MVAEKPHAEEEPPEVYAVHIDPSPSSSGLAITGGRDDAAYVWVMNSGQVLFECTGMLLKNSRVHCVFTVQVLWLNIVICLCVCTVQVDLSCPKLVW